MEGERKTHQGRYLYCATKALHNKKTAGTGVVPAVARGRFSHKARAYGVSVAIRCRLTHPPRCGSAFLQVQFLGAVIDLF